MKTKAKSKLPTMHQSSPVAAEGIGSNNIAERYWLFQAQKLIHKFAALFKAKVCASAEKPGRRINHKDPKRSRLGSKAA